MEIALISENAIKAKSIIQTNVESKILLREILDVQKIDLRPILCETLYQALISYVQDVATGGEKNADYDKLLQDYVADYMAAAVVLNLIVNLKFRLSNKGAISTNDSFTTILSTDDLNYWSGLLNKKKLAYKSALIRYLDSAGLGCNGCDGGGRTDRDETTDVIGWYLEN